MCNFDPSLYVLLVAISNLTSLPLPYSAFEFINDPFSSFSVLYISSPSYTSLSRIVWLCLSFSI